MYRKHTEPSKINEKWPDKKVNFDVVCFAFFSPTQKRLSKRLPDVERAMLYFIKCSDLFSTL